MAGPTLWKQLSLYFLFVLIILLGFKISSHFSCRSQSRIKSNQTSQSWQDFALCNTAVGFSSNEFRFSCCLIFHSLVWGDFCGWFCSILLLLSSPQEKWESFFFLPLWKRNFSKCVYLLICLCLSLCQQPGLLCAPQPSATCTETGISQWKGALGVLLSWWSFEPSLSCPSCNKPQGPWSDLKGGLLRGRSSTIFGSADFLWMGDPVVWACYQLCLWDSIES